MGKQIVANDFLNFSYHLANGLTANPGVCLEQEDMSALFTENRKANRFIFDPRNL